MDFEFQMWYLIFTLRHILVMTQTYAYPDSYKLPQFCHYYYCQWHTCRHLSMHNSGLNKCCVLRSIILLCIWGLQYSTRAKNINYCVLHNYKQRPWNFAIKMSSVLLTLWNYCRLKWFLKYMLSSLLALQQTQLLYKCRYQNILWGNGTYFLWTNIML